MYLTSPILNTHMLFITHKNTSTSHSFSKYTETKDQKVLSGNYSEPIDHRSEGIRVGELIGSNIEEIDYSWFKYCMQKHYKYKTKHVSKTIKKRG